LLGLTQDFALSVSNSNLAGGITMHDF